MNPIVEFMNRNMKIFRVIGAMRKIMVRLAGDYFSVRFANEVTYFAIPSPKTADADALFAGFEDAASGGFVEWTTDAAATRPGVAVDWADRNMILPAQFWRAA